MNIGHNIKNLICVYCLPLARHDDYWCFVSGCHKGDRNRKESGVLKKNDTTLRNGLWIVSLRREMTRVLILRRKRTKKGEGEWVMGHFST